ncbi:MAG: aspartate kinase [Muribaculaceae bacterium]|nr:aspartate kinase [Muribaculaceae bacterium]
MRVLKFGGTSVGTVESLRNVKAIVESRSDQCIVTVSALGGITDRLIDTARRAAAGDLTYHDCFNAIAERHHAVIDGTVTDPAALAATHDEVGNLLNELSTLYNAIALLGELTGRSLDLIVSYGERMSCLIVTAMLKDAVLCQSLDFIRTRLSFDKHVLDSEATSVLIAEKVLPMLADGAETVIVPGFIARDADGRITNLGRGGSDYTAAILAAETGAEVLEIWTDVDGFMTADPRVVKDARVIDRLSFVEAMELCNFGAKVVYPPTIYPVFNRSIPILIKNTFRPEAPGTIIAEGTIPEHHGACGISSMTPTAMIRISGSCFSDFDRIFNALSRQGVDIFMASPANATFGLRGADTDRAMNILSDELAPELTAGIITGIEAITDLSTIAVVGRGLNTIAGIDQTMLNSLNAIGIPVPATPRSNSSTTVACMVPAGDLPEAMKAVHDTFITSEKAANCTTCTSI